MAQNRNFLDTHTGAPVSGLGFRGGFGSRVRGLGDTAASIL